MVIPNTEPKMHPGYARPYTFDILSIVMYELNDPEQHANLMKTFYDKVSHKVRIIRFEEMPKYIGIEVEGSNMSCLDMEAYIAESFSESILTCFAANLAMIPGFLSLIKRQAMEYITNSFPILNLTPADSDRFIFHICFGL